MAKDLRNLAKSANFGSPFYYAIWGEGLLVMKLREFDPADLGMSQDEAWLFTEDWVVNAKSRRQSLWETLRIGGEAMGWTLVECLGRRRPVLKRTEEGLPMLVRGREWRWLWGDLDAERVQVGLSLWGVLKHCRREEWERSPDGVISAY